MASKSQPKSEWQLRREESDRKAKEEKRKKKEEARKIQEEKDRNCPIKSRRVKPTRIEYIVHNRGGGDLPYKREHTGNVWSFFCNDFFDDILPELECDCCFKFEWNNQDFDHCTDKCLRPGVCPGPPYTHAIAYPPHKIEGRICKSCVYKWDLWNEILDEYPNTAWFSACKYTSIGVRIS